MSPVQSAAPPAPRITLDVTLPPPADHRLTGLRPPGRLAAGPDGSLYVAASSFQPLPDGLRPARSARIELHAYSRDGAERYRTLLPVPAGIGPTGFNAESLGVAGLATGEAILFLSSSNARVAPPRDEHAVTTIFRVDAGGRVLRTAPVPPAANVPGAFYRARFYAPTGDGGLLVGGGYGPDPFKWWIGKFDVQGRRSWQAGPGSAYPEDVYGLGVKEDGSVSAVIREVDRDSGAGQRYVAHFAADGTPQGRTAFNAPGKLFALLRSGVWVSAIDTFQTPGAPALVRLDEQGKELGRTPWPYDQTRRLIADGDGVAAIACTMAGPQCFVVRADANGKVRWRSDPGTFEDIVRTPAGQIAAILWSDDLQSPRLVRYADPRSN